MWMPTPAGGTLRDVTLSFFNGLYLLSHLVDLVHIRYGNNYRPQYTLSWPTGHIGSKARSLGQILVKPLVHFRGYSFDPIFMKLCQNVLFIFFKSRPELKNGSCLVKTRSLNHFLGKQCIHSRKHSFGPIFMKLCKNVSIKYRPELKLGHVKSRN